ncbi:MAG: type I restriction enzyme HsdR N-terminal domain-containing protein [Candidatus Poribacteria bacterium]|nr:type I restriction enzyme HsdR N-terminal domain-containing protein [Candidatus Poribacteria bacterium]
MYKVRLTEDQIRERVVAYFKKEYRFPSRLYKIKREYRIKVFSTTGRADLVLHKDREIIAIVECKEEGRNKDAGIEQLKSYLSVTDTRLGIFANSDDPKHWHYFENFGRLKIEPIKHHTFCSFVNEFIEDESKIEDRIQKRAEDRIEEEEAERRVTQKAVYDRAQKLIEQKAHEHISEGSTNQYADNQKIKYDSLQSQLTQTQDDYNQLKTKYDSLQSQLTQTRTKLEESDSGRWWGWFLFIIAAIIIIVIVSNQ